MTASSPDARRITPAFVLALALLGTLAFGGLRVWQQGRPAHSSVGSAAALAASLAARNQAELSEKNATQTAGPTWDALDAVQKKALEPLASRWGILSELQKRRWLVIAKNFPTLPAKEQQRLHARMTEWASLSAQQRSQARLNYAVTNKLSADSKRAQWEAYQALSEEEKNRLAAATHRPMGAATAVYPVAPRKLVQVPAASATTNNTVSSSLPAETKPIAVETAPVAVPVAEPTPLPPMTLVAPPTEAVTPMSADAAAQYSH
jgi:hypothetical protein